MSKSKYQKKAQRAIKEEHLFMLHDEEEIDIVSSSNKRESRNSKNSKIIKSKSTISTNNQSTNNQSTNNNNSESIDEGDFLTASELGIEDEEMYERLLSIFEGDDICPEDYDVLLELDKNNVRKTMDENEISNYPIIIVGDKDATDNVATDSNDGSEHTGKIDTSSWKCDICLESWSDLSVGTELRRLPCGHIFCKLCIDDWLSQRSQKCPTLSCFWTKE